MKLVNHSIADDSFHKKDPENNHRMYVTIGGRELEVYILYSPSKNTGRSNIKYEDKILQYKKAFKYV